MSQKIARIFFLPLILAYLLVLGVSEAYAHRVSIFAWVEGTKILGQGKFANGNKAIKAKISAYGLSSGELVFEGQTDEKGEFSLEIPQIAPKEGLLLKIDAGQGHQNSWKMESYEFSPSGSSKIEDNAPASVEIKTLDQPKIEEGSLDYAKLAALVRAEVAAEIAPLRKMLAESTQKEASFSEILGGIGWLIGLSGILAYAFSRRKA